MAEPPHTAELEDINQFSRNLGLTKPTVRRRVVDDDLFPKPVRIGGKNYWFADERRSYTKKLMKQRDARLARLRAPEDRPAA